MKASTKIRKHFEREIERATTVNELVWIDTEFKPETKLACDDLLTIAWTAFAETYFRDPVH